MLLVEFEPTTPVFERTETIQALGRAANVIGLTTFTESCFKRSVKVMGPHVKWM
jgi:hypothetical protein